MRKINLFVVSMFTNIFCIAQSTDLQTTCATAYENSSGSTIITYAVGEMVLINTWNSATLIISQGILQPINNTVTGLISFTSSELKVYPNPTNSTVTIDISNPKPGKYSFQIVDLTGKPMITQEQFSSGHFIKQINVSRFAQGAYFLRIDFFSISGNLKTGIYKIVKMN